MKTCSFERSSWYQQYSKKIIFKGTCPSLKFRNVRWDFSTLEKAHGLKFRVKALFLMPKTMTLKFVQYSKVLVNLGIIFESHRCLNIQKCQPVSAEFYLMYLRSNRYFQSMWALFAILNRSCDEFNHVREVKSGEKF